MKSDKIIKITVISAIIFLFLSILGLTYAYFSLEIEGTPKDIVMTTGDLRLEYKDETELKLDGAFPGDSVSKVVTVKNVGTVSVVYSLYWGDLINTIENFELHVTLDCKSYINYGESNQTESGTCDNIYRAVPISNTTTTGNIKGNISIEPGITQEYTVIVKFDNKNYPQNGNMNRTFTGKIGIQEYTAPEVVNCTFDGELTQGAEYVNGQYTYRYKQQGAYSSTTDLAWNNIGTDGWGVQLTDKASTDPVTSKVCTYINDKPVISMSYMFANSQAASIDLSSFNTSNVTNMDSMFHQSQVASLDLSSFDTSKVTKMSNMFTKSKVEELDLSGFDTSNVTNMNGMFVSSETKIIDLSSFDTSNVTSMYYMFYGSKATTLDLSSFDTKNVTVMSGMFGNSQALVIDLSNFDTSKVTDMSWMFYGTKAEKLDLSSFNTSNVTNMSDMFGLSKVVTLKGLEIFNTSNVTNMSNMFEFANLTTLYLSSFDTSKVTNMKRMFYAMSKLKSIYVSDKFITDNVTSSDYMFDSTGNLVGGNGTAYNSSYIDKTYARIDTESTPGYFTAKQ